MADIALGLWSLVKVVMDDPRAAECYSGSLAKYAQEVARYATVASIVAHMSDAFLFELLEDDRVAKGLSKLDEALRDQTEWLLGTTDATWAVLAVTIGDMSPRLFSVWCVHSANRAYAFVERSALQVHMGIHGVFAQGMSVITWTTGELSLEFCFFQVQAPPPGRNAKAKIVDAVSLLAEVRWSSTSAEDVLALRWRTSIPQSVWS